MTCDAGRSRLVVHQPLSRPPGGLPGAGVRAAARAELGPGLSCAPQCSGPLLPLLLLLRVSCQGQGCHGSRSDGSGRDCWSCAANGLSHSGGVRQGRAGPRGCLSDRVPAERCPRHPSCPDPGPSPAALPGQPGLWASRPYCIPCHPSRPWRREHNGPRLCSQAPAVHVCLCRRWDRGLCSTKDRSNYSLGPSPRGQGGHGRAA